MLELESKVLAAVLVDKSIRTTVIPLLKESLFLSDFNQRVCKAMISLDTRLTPIDPLTILEELERSGIVYQDDAYNLTKLTHLVVNGNNAEAHTRLLIEKWMRREGSAMATDYALRLEDTTTDIFKVLDNFQRDLSAITEHVIKGQNQHISIPAEKVREQAASAKINTDHLIGLSSGISQLDILTGGWKAPDLIVVAARPGMGKTSLVLNMGKHIAHEKPVGIFSLEMSSEQLTRKILSMESGLSTGDIERGNFDDIDYHINKISGYDIYFNDTAGISSMELQNAARQMVEQYGVKIIMIDYIQLMSCKGYKSREQEVSAISRNLKAVAKKMNIPVIALSQLSRKCEERSDKRPLLSDLRESGSIEQDADLVMFLYRPEYYGIIQDEYGDSLKGVTELIISKHRNGALSTITTYFDAETTTFGSHDREMKF